MFHPEALADYLRCIRLPGTIHAMCEDYRAGVSIDFELDEKDRGVKKSLVRFLLCGAIKAKYEVIRCAGRLAGLG